MNYLTTIKNSVDKIIVLVVSILAIISIVMIGSTHISTGFIARDTVVQAAAYLIGTVAAIIICYFHYAMFRGQESWLYAISIALLLLVYIPGLGMEQFGARAWINLRFTTIQPSEFVKILFVFIMAEHLSKHKDDLYSFKGLIKAGLVAAPIILIVLKEDLGSALVFASMWLAMVFFAGVNLKVIGKFFALFLGMIPVAYLMMASYQKERIEAFLHPENLSLQGNYQVWQGKVAMGSGGLFGKGLFNGTQKELDFIPVQTSDFIFSVLVEELGFIGGLFVITLFAVLLLRFTKIVRECTDLYGALIVVGFIGMFLFQVFENLAMNMGIMPVTGITLPFLSYGGSSIISNMLAVGIILNVSARGRGMAFN